MGPLMKAARFQPQVKVVDPDDEEQQDDENWEFVNLGGGQSFGIASGGLEEKATACSMLVCYVKELGGKFGDYVEEVAQLMIPLLKFYFYDAVRASAAQATAPIIAATAESKGLDAAVELWKHYFKEILSALEAEPESEIVVCFLFFCYFLIALRGSCLDQFPKSLRFWARTFWEMKKPPQKCLNLLETDCRNILNDQIHELKLELKMIMMKRSKRICSMKMMRIVSF